jgi:3',5'-cyclic AMP phosphodiesterase CpdA
MGINKRLLPFLLPVLLSGCSPVKEGDRINESAIDIFVATDIHYLAGELNDKGEAFQKYISSGDGKMLPYIEDVTDAFLDEAAQKQPELLIISGDLTNNGERESHKAMAEKLNELERNSGTRVFVIPGNHDIANPWARGFQGAEQYVADTVGPDEFSKLYKNAGYDEAISRDKASLSYLAAATEDLWLLMLDTSIYDFNELVGAPTTNGRITSDTFDWIRQCSEMAKEKQARILTVMHHNLFRHNELLYSGFTLDNAEEALKVFEECGLRLVLSGHIHMQDIKSNQSDNPVYEMVTSSLAVHPVQYGVLSFHSPGDFEYMTSRVDVEGWAQQLGKEGELRNFSEYARTFFDKASREKATEALTEAGIYTDTEIQLMSDTMSILNRNYFAGTSSSVQDEVMKSEGYKLWLAASEPKRLRDYVLSMLTAKKDQNHLKLQLGKVE